MITEFELERSWRMLTFLAKEIKDLLLTNDALVDSLGLDEDTMNAVRDGFYDMETIAVFHHFAYSPPITKPLIAIVDGDGNIQTTFYFPYSQYYDVLAPKISESISKWHQGKLNEKNLSKQSL